MHKSRLGVIVIDCKTEDLANDAAFWSKTLGYEARHDPDDGKYVELITPDGDIRLILQVVDHEPRLHLDIETNDQPAEVARIMALGAKQVGTHPRWTILEAPSGHRFCIVKPQRSDFEDNANRWE